MQSARAPRSPGRIASGAPVRLVRTRERLAARRFMLLQNRVHSLWGPLFTETVATVEQHIFNCSATREDYYEAVKRSDAMIFDHLDARLRWQFGRQGLKAKI